MAVWRPTVAGRVLSAWVALASAILLVSCSGDIGRRAGTSDPLAEDLGRAFGVAHEARDAPWILDLASARYSVDGDELALDDRVYVFVSDDGAASYHLVRFYTDGTVSSGPVAGIALFAPEPFEFTQNTLTSVDAIEMAWELAGEALVERCGPLRWVDVTGTRDEQGRQWWTVEYRIGGQTHTIRLNTWTGALDDIDEQPC